MKIIRKSLIIFVFSLNLALFGIGAANAQTPSPTPDFERRGEEIMGQMMGGNHDEMDRFMDQMMGVSRNREMHEMMGRMNTLGMDADDMRPMADFMSACQSQVSDNFGMMGGWNWNSMMGYGLGIGGIFLALGAIIMVIFWATVIVGAIVLLRWLVNQLRGGAAAGKAMDILKEKYAKGEITKEEFESKKKDLM